MPGAVMYDLTDVRVADLGDQLLAALSHTIYRYRLCPKALRHQEADTHCRRIDLGGVKVEVAAAACSEVLRPIEPAQPERTVANDRDTRVEIVIRHELLEKHVVLMEVPGMLRRLPGCRRDAS